MNPNRAISVDKTKCNNCHACISVCPVKSCIKATGEAVEIIDDRCLACGRCVRACQHKARTYFDDAAQFFTDAAAGVPIVALLAPAAVSVFPDIERLMGWLRSLGVQAFFDVSFGAELYVHSCLEESRRTNPPLRINSSCPVIVTWCEVYKPELIPYLVPVQSPMIHTALMIREFFPEYAACRLAAISPCAAKRREFTEEGHIDYNVTLGELKKYLHEHSINLADFNEYEFTGPQAERGVAFSTPGGMHDLFLREAPEITNVRCIQGVSIFAYLNEIPAMFNDGVHPQWVDCLNCARGCNSGPGTSNRNVPLEYVEYAVRKREHKHIHDYSTTINDTITRYWKSGFYNRAFNDRSKLVADIRAPTEAQLVSVFKDMRKYTQADMLNCSACGYGSCAAMANAIFNNLNKSENCSHYLRLKAEAASESKTNFLATMSHEIRTPLNSIIGLTEVELQKEHTPKNIKENLYKILSSGSTLLGIINDILDVSKIEAGKFELVPDRYEVAVIINDAVQLNIIRAAEKPILFKLNITDNVPSELIGDELRVKQILNNLLSNAFKYTRRGTVTLEVCFSVEKTNKGEKHFLVFTVEDTGIGIKQQDLKKLFSEYMQLDSKANRSIEGTGLGLAIAKRIATMMSGEITVESEYGVGSKFVVKLQQTTTGAPCIDAETIESLKQFTWTSNKIRRSEELVRVQMPYARVLVVDDVQTNLDVAKGLLAAYGIKTDTASSGVEALSIIREAKEPYDAVFIDYMMPVMDGLQTGKAIREIPVDYAKNLPLIALTADAIAGSREKFIAHGFCDFISKPINILKLDEVLHKHVYNKEKEASMGLLPQAAERQKKILAEKMSIDGVDFDEALRRIGSEELYFKIVHSYIRNTPEILEKIKNVSRETLNDYAVIVHGIKGASRAIGAEDAGRRAEELEHAAKHGRIGFCLAANKSFHEVCEKLIAALRVYADARIAESNDKPLKDAPEPALLTRLREALECYDMLGVDEAMTRLEAYTYRERGELVTALRACIDNSDFAAAREKLD